MDITELKNVINLIESAYEQIDKSLDYNSFDSIERGVALGMDEILQVERKLKELLKMKQLENITFLETTVTDMTHDEVLTEFWGNEAWSNMFGDDEDIDNSLMYAVYNDEIAENIQLGTITEIYNNDNELIGIKVYRDTFC